MPKYAKFEPMPPSETYHIIWNLLLADKTVKLTPELIASNRIAHVVAILPSVAKYKELSSAIPDVAYTVLEYGDAHEAVLDIPLFETTSKLINDIASRCNGEGEYRNILVFCNNGYQRSIPFLVYYLTRHHGDEVPNVSRAIDIILPQVNREGYSKERDMYITNVQQLLSVC